ncbi:MAG: class II glutamine amidotransferase, partial [Bdellovibrionales bacterium]|nr:class II glutamine amidotransferase [Bdellovibrionales bacterium]
MCRIFGFRSILESKVHNSLVHAENALEIQSQIHSDGWGVAYYIEQTPHVIKSEKAAIDDRLFKKISGIVRSTTVVAHVRKATEGQNDILNTHPFQYGPWIFVHNGHIKNFDQKKSELLKHIDEQLKSFILGNTDSEILFYFILSKMKKYKNFS